MNREEIISGIKRFSPWFYEFDLGGGLAAPSALPPEVLRIHRTRLEMMNRAVEAHFGKRLSAISALDCGCHEGYFSVELAQKNLRRVVGADARKLSLEKAEFVSCALNLKNVSWVEADCEKLPFEPGEFELTLFLGVLYHLENPMLCLRNMAGVTRELCLVETQVIDEVEGFSEWGCKEWTRPYRGTLAVIDESGEFGNGSAETGTSPLALCPSPKAAEFMLRQAGFSRVEILPPPPDGYEQHARKKRIFYAAYK